MPYTITTATKKIHQLSKRLWVIQGGTSAGKTIGTIQVLIDMAQRDKTPTLTSITSESYPHLKRGAMKDFLDIMQTQGYYNPDAWNKTEATYTFETGSRIEFFSLDQPHKVRGPRRDRLFMNEANNNPFETFEQLEVRTKDLIILDYNPTAQFWVHEYVLDRDDVEFIILTYKDNEALDPQIVSTIEKRKNRPEWWKVYGQGELGDGLEGRIYTDWEIIDELPHEARLERYGVDFGWNPDPAAVVAIYYWNGGYILDEVSYQLEMSNREMANMLKNMDKALVIADSAEPKSIAEVRLYGINVLPCKKGADSIRHGIMGVQDQKVFVTKSSVNLIKEYRNYMWDVDKNGKQLNKPEGGKDHLMDAVRYAMNSLVPVIRKKEMVINLPDFIKNRKAQNRGR